jgi:hypothetical protein
MQAGAVWCEDGSQAGSDPVVHLGFFRLKPADIVIAESPGAFVLYFLV